VTRRKLGKYFDTSRILKKVYNSIIKINKKIDLKEKRLKLINGYLGDKNYFWKEITERRGGRVEVDIDLEKLRHSYEENFNCISQSDESIKLENSMRVVVDKYKKFIGSKTIRTRVRVCEITKILKSLKNKKKGGHNNCCNEMFKYSTTTSLPHIIANLFQNIIRGGYFPDNLNIGLISTIIKDSTAINQELDNTRPINLSEVLSIILEHFILTHVQKRSLHRHQFGFRQKSSCVHAVFSLNEIIEDVKAKKSNAYAVFLDFSIFKDSTASNQELDNTRPINLSSDR